MANYTTPIAPIIVSPKGIEIPIQSIQLDIASLTCIEVSYGRARLYPVEKGTNKQEPKVYLGNTNYITVLPNDNVNSQSFISVTGPETIEEYNHNSKSQIKETTLALIVWFNAMKLNKFGDVELFEDIKSEIEQKLSFNSFVNSIDEIIDEDARAIFSPYDIEQCDRELLMFPFGGMRFDLTIGYESFCQ